MIRLLVSATQAKCLVPLFVELLRPKYSQLVIDAMPQPETTYDNYVCLGTGAAIELLQQGVSPHKLLVLLGTAADGASPAWCPDCNECSKHLSNAVDSLHLEK